MTTKNPPKTKNNPGNKQARAKFLKENPDYINNLLNYLTLHEKYAGNLEEMSSDPQYKNVETPDFYNLPSGLLNKNKQVKDWFSKNAPNKQLIYSAQDSATQAHGLMPDPARVELARIGTGNNTKKVYYLSDADHNVLERYPDKNVLDSVRNKNPYIDAVYKSSSSKFNNSNINWESIKDSKDFTREVPLKNIPQFQDAYLNSYGNGGWLKEHWDGIAGGALAIGGGILATTAVGAPIAAPMISSGVGMISNDINQSKQQDAAEKATSQQIQLQEDQQLAAYTAQKNNELFNTSPQMAMGGKIPNNNYEGQSHAGPNKGIPIDSQGNPAIETGQNPVGLSEDGEVNYGDFIFSDKLSPKNSKKTFAEIAKKIKSKYKNRLGEDLDKEDKYAKAALESELENLASQQEQLKRQKAEELGLTNVGQNQQQMMPPNQQAMQQPQPQQPQPQQSQQAQIPPEMLPGQGNGQQMPQFEGGGSIFRGTYNNNFDSAHKSNILDFERLNPIGGHTDPNNIYNNQPYIPNSIENTMNKNTSLTSNMDNNFISNEGGMYGNYKGLEEAVDMNSEFNPNPANIDTNATETTQNQPFEGSSVAPAYIGAGVSVASDVAKMISNHQTADNIRGMIDPVQARTISPQEVSFARTREQDRARALNARREAMRTARNSGVGNRYADMAIDMVLKGNDALSNRLIQSEEKEDLANAQARAQAQQFNTQAQSRADIFNNRQKQRLQSQALAMETQGRNALMNSAAQGAQHVGGAYQNRKRFANTAQLMAENFVVMQDENGNIIKVPIQTPNNG